MIFVTVGSQKFQFDRLLEKIDVLVDKKVINEKVVAQIGCSTYIPKNYEYYDFLTQDIFNDYIDKCDLIITHAGTGIIVNSLKKNKKVIAIPRLSKYGEHVDDHQIQLIDEFKELNFIEPVYELDDLNQALIDIKKKNYNRYVSNTDKVINDIINFIENEEK